MVTAVKNMKLLLMLIFCLGISACSKKSPKSSVKQKIAMGNPENLFKDTERNSQVDTQAFKDGETIYLYQLIAFVDADFAQEPLSQEEIEKQAAPEEEYTERLTMFPFKVSVDNKEMSLRGSVEGKNISIQFLPESDNYGQIMKDPSEPNAKISLIHFSQSEDQKITSIMYRSEHNNEVSVGVLYFTKSSKVIQPSTGNTDFNYIRGPGVKVAWKGDKALEINYASTLVTSMKKTVIEAAKLWGAEMQPAVQFTAKEVAKNVPFSDLQNKGFYLIDDYYAVPEKTASALGLTISLHDNSSTSMADSDVLVFSKEFEKSGVDIFHPALKNHLRITIIHELGHFVGLDHIFDGTKSVMSYELDQLTLTDYDKAAVRELYSK